MIFDSHAHIYPDKIALKASKAIESFYDLPVPNDGSVGSLLKLGEEAHVDRFLVHSVATSPAQVSSINDFIIRSVKSYPDKFVGFCAMHQDYEDFEKELERVKAEGLIGIKLHPDFQKFNIDDEKLFPLYEAAAALKLPILFHMGDIRYEYSKAVRLYNVINRFPKLTVIAAHLGGYSEWDVAADVLKGTGIYADTSSSLKWLEPEHARKLFECYGMDRILFASDYPMWEPEAELERLSRIPLSEEEKQLILWDNAKRLFLCNMNKN